MTRRRSFLVSFLGLPLLAYKVDEIHFTTGQITPKGETMKLESTAFTAGNLIPARYTCDGEDLSPPLSWDAPPEGTRSLALICDDPDAPRGTFVHWVLYNLPADLRQLPEGIPAQPQPPVGGIHGKNDFGRSGYGGPCPPSGTHRYFFRLYALDQTLNLAQGATKAELLEAMNGHILISAELMGRYARQR